MHDVTRTASCWRWVLYHIFVGGLGRRSRDVVGWLGDMMDISKQNFVGLFDFVQANVAHFLRQKNWKILGL